MDSGALGEFTQSQDAECQICRTPQSSRRDPLVLYTWIAGNLTDKDHIPATQGLCWRADPHLPQPGLPSQVHEGRALAPHHQAAHCSPEGLQWWEQALQQGVPWSSLKIQIVRPHPYLLS